MDKENEASKLRERVAPPVMAGTFAVWTGAREALAEVVVVHSGASEPGDWLAWRLIGESGLSRMDSWHFKRYDKVSMP